MKQIAEYFPQALLLRQGTTVDDAEASLTRAVERFLSDLAAVDDALLHAPVDGDGWSPAEYADHLYRVTLLYLHGVEGAARGEEPVVYERGWRTDSGGLVSPPGGEPLSGRGREELADDLRSGSAALVAAVRRAVADGAGERVSHVNPYFGPLTPLGCLQMAAVHAVHHSRTHLARVI